MSRNLAPSLLSVTTVPPPSSYSHIPYNRRQANGPKEAEDPCAEGARQKNVVVVVVVLVECAKTAVAPPHN